MGTKKTTTKTAGGPADQEALDLGPNAPETDEAAPEKAQEEAGGNETPERGNGNTEVLEPQEAEPGGDGQDRDAIVAMAEEETRLRDHAMSYLRSMGAAVTPGALDRIAALIEQYIEQQKRLKLLVLRLTDPFDWIEMHVQGDQEPEPYLQRSGCDKLRAPFRVQTEHDGGVRESHDDGTYEYVYTGRVRALKFSEDWIQVTGSRWSGDPFFRGSKSRPKIPDPGDVRKAAESNWYQRAFKAALGLQRLSWEDLEKAGIPRSKVRRITYDGGGGGGGGGDRDKNPPGTGPGIWIYLPYQDVSSRDIVKKNTEGGARWVDSKKSWWLPYTEKNLSMVADLAAANSKIKWKVVNVENPPVTGNVGDDEGENGNGNGNGND